MRAATLGLNASVHGWGPLEGDADAGFSACQVAVLGRYVELELLPGEGMLIALSMYASD